jgi:hypothetical protein
MHFGETWGWWDCSGKIERGRESDGKGRKGL